MAGNKIQKSKPREVAVRSDVKMALIAFTPTRPLNEFDKQKEIEEFQNRYKNTLEYRIMMKQKWHAEQELMEKLDNLSLINGESSIVHNINMAPDSAPRARLTEVKLRQPTEAQNEPQRGQPDPEGLDQEIDS